MRIAVLLPYLGYAQTMELTTENIMWQLAKNDDIHVTYFIPENFKKYVESHSIFQHPHISYICLPISFGSAKDMKRGFMLSNAFYN